jgi:hypothetical protein
MDLLPAVLTICRTITTIITTPTPIFRFSAEMATAEVPTTARTRHLAGLAPEEGLTTLTHILAPGIPTMSTTIMATAITAPEESRAAAISRLSRRDIGPDSRQHNSRSWKGASPRPTIQIFL